MYNGNLISTRTFATGRNSPGEFSAKLGFLSASFHFFPPNPFLTSTELPNDNRDCQNKTESSLDLELVYKLYIFHSTATAHYVVKNGRRPIHPDGPFPEAPGNRSGLFPDGNDDDAASAREATRWPRHAWWDANPDP